jgi:hypothetical protein
MEARLLRSIIIGTILLAGIEPSLAAPMVSTVIGAVSDGQQINITGSGFGSTGPMIALFDDFEKGTNGNTLVTNQAEIGTWYAVQAPAYTSYSSTNKVSGLLAARFDLNYSGSLMPVSKFKLTSPTDSVFVSFWTLIPLGTSIPGTNGPEDGGVNWKVAWIMDDNEIGEDDPNRGDIVLPVIFGDGNAIAGNDAPFSTIWTNDPPYNWGFTAGSWWRLSWWLKAGSSDNGEIKMYTMSPSSPQTQRVNMSNFTTRNAGREWWFLNMMGFGRKDSNAHPTYDDFYIATGDNAQARVEIGNTATYSACTNLAILTPTSWSDSQIAATVRQGSFAGGSKAYLYVVDTTGAVNANGYPITLVGSGINSTCSNGACDSGETCATCPQDCVQATAADINPCDRSVSFAELTVYLARWKASSADVTLAELINAIAEWKN